MARSSIYRTLGDRVPKNDVHCVERHVLDIGMVQQEPAPPAREQDWSRQRKATPPEHLLAATLIWLTNLPVQVQPTATRDAFPRIANTLATLWHKPDALRDYLNDLLIDHRGGRRGFPFAVLQELHTLNDYHARRRRSPSRSQ